MTAKDRTSIRRWLPAVLCLCCAGLFVSALRADDPAGTARWYKGNTHAHSLWSDGDEFPEMVADWYKGRGYDFLAISDHDCLMEGEKWVPVDHGKRHVRSAVVEKCCRRFGAEWLQMRGEGNKREVRLKTFDEVRAKLAEPDKFLLIQGVEISGKVGIHINALNLAEPIAPRVGRDVVETIALNLASVAEQAKRLGRPILAHVNHPNSILSICWSEYDIAPEELAAARGARFFEVCNAGRPILNQYGGATHPSVEKLWDIANTIRIAKMKAPPLYGIAADDAHHYQEFSPKQRANPGRAWIVVRAKSLTAENLIEAIDRGDFYASTGVILREIVYDAKQRTLDVEVHSEPGVRYTIEFIGTLAGVDFAGTPVESVAPSGKKKPKRSGMKYSPEVGKVLTSVQGDCATYRFTGKELYVRAVIRSDKPIPNAYAWVQKQEAWCQPVGWERR